MYLYLSDVDILQWVDKLALVDDFLRDGVRQYFLGQQIFQSVTSNLPVHGINHLASDLLDVLRRRVRSLLHLKLYHSHSMSKTNILSLIEK